jgi:beta-glucosidase
VLSEGGGIHTLIYNGLAPDMKTAGRLALQAGVDVGISYESGYMLDLIASVREGSVPIDLVDRAVRRILRQKFRLGLFEKPTVRLDRALAAVHNPAHQDLALEAAREGIVLLKNEGRILPLDRHKIKSIAVIGPNADDRKNQLGDYVAETVLQDVVTVLDGVRFAAPGCEVIFVKGCSVKGCTLNEIAAAKQAAENADAVIVVVGENQWQAQVDGERVGTSGEGFDAATLELTGMQEDLVRAVTVAGKPVTAVLINGRALAVRWIAAHVPAVIEAWNPGEKGGQAVAEVIFGDVNPSGKLTVTVPRHAGQLPVYYNHPKSKRYWIEQGWGMPYVDLDPKPLYPFGHGLSYTRFTYGNLQLGKKAIGPHDSLEIRLDVENSGNCPGKETVQLYVEDVIASVVTPVKSLRGFQKADLRPGEKKTVTFRLTPVDLALLNPRLVRVVEPGEFKVMIGASSEDIRLADSFSVIESLPDPCD